MIGDDRKVSKGDEGAEAHGADAGREPTQEEIAERAYERFMARAGSPEDDWYAAERELRAGRRPAQQPEDVTISSPPPSAQRAAEAAPRKAPAPRRDAKPAKKPGSKSTPKA